MPRLGGRFLIMWLRMTRSQFLLSMVTSLACSVSASAQADDEFVTGAKSLSARDFDKALPDQSIEAWLRAHLPVGYEAVWGEEIADCGEGTGKQFSTRMLRGFSVTSVSRMDSYAQIRGSHINRSERTFTTRIVIST